MRVSSRYFSAENLDPRLRAGLVGHWIGGGSGLTLFDCSGHGDHGQLKNGPTWTLNRERSALRFDGVDDHVVMSGAYLSMGAGNWSAAAWVQARSASAEPGIVVFDGAGLVLSTASGKIGMLQGSDVVMGDSTALPLDVWVHLVATRSGTTYQLFRNGIDVSSALSDPGWALSAQYYIGRGYSAGRWNGVIEDVRVYNRALSAAEISLLAKPSFQPVIPRRGLGF